MSNEVSRDGLPEDKAPKPSYKSLDEAVIKGNELSQFVPKQAEAENVSKLDYNKFHDKLGDDFQLHRGNRQIIKDYSAKLAEEVYLEKKKQFEEQGFVETSAKFLTNLVGELVFGTAHAVGSFVDTSPMGMLYKSNAAAHDSYSIFSESMFTKGAKSAKEWVSEDLAPIHLDPDTQGQMDWGSYAWWAKNSVSIASTATIALPVAGWAKGIGMLGKLGKLSRTAYMAGKTVRATKAMNLADDIVKMGAKSVKGAQTAAKEAKLAKEGSAAFNYTEKQVADAVHKGIVSRHIESSMEAQGVFTEQYEKYISMGMSHDEATKHAAKGAAFTYNSNWSLALMDIAQYMALGKGASVSKAILSGKLAKEAGESVTKAYLKKAGEVAKQFASEGFEEAYQFVSTEEGKRHADIIAGIETPGETSLGQRLWNDYLRDPELKTAALFGGLGGGAFHVVGTSQTVLSRAGKIQEKLTGKNIFGEGYAQRVREIQTRADIVNRNLKAYQVAVENANDGAAAAARANMGYDIGVNAARVGNLDIAVKQMEELKTMSPEELAAQGFDADFTNHIDQAIKDAQRAAELWAESNDQYGPELANAIGYRRFHMEKAGTQIKQAKNNIETLKQKLPRAEEMSGAGNAILQAKIDIIGRERMMKYAKWRLKNEKLTKAEKTHLQEAIQNDEALIAARKEIINAVEEETLSTADKQALAGVDASYMTDIAKESASIAGAEYLIDAYQKELAELTSPDGLENAKKKMEASKKAAEKAEKQRDAEKRAEVTDAELNGTPVSNIEGYTTEEIAKLEELLQKIDSGEADIDKLSEDDQAYIADYRRKKQGIELTEEDGEARNAHEDHQKATKNATAHSYTETTDAVEADWGVESTVITKELTPLAWISLNNTQLTKAEKELYDTPENRALTAYIEGNNSLEGVTLVFEINEKVLDNPLPGRENIYPEIKKQLAAGQIPTNIGEVPITAKFTKNGAPLMYNKVPLEMSLHDPYWFQRLGKTDASEAQMQTAIAHKTLIVENLLNGVQLSAPILKKSAGVLYMPVDAKGNPIKHSIGEALQKNIKDIEFVVGDSIGNYMTSENELDDTLSRLSGATSGAIYAKATASNGMVMPIRTFASKITQNEADLIYDIYKELLASPGTKKKRLPQALVDKINTSKDKRLSSLGNIIDLKNITYGELLEELIHSGTSTKGQKEGQLYIDTFAGTRSIFYGTNRPIDIKVFSTDTGKAQFLNWVTSNRNRQIKASRLNDVNYRSYLDQTGIITTPVTKTPEGNLLIQQIVTYGQISQHIPVTGLSAEAVKALTDLGYPKKVIAKMSSKEATQIIKDKKQYTLPNQGTSTTESRVVDIITNQLDLQAPLMESLETLANNGAVIRNNGAVMVNDSGRDMILFNINGTVLPMYRSSSGTSSKTKGAWYPFFFSTNEWIAKAMSGNYKEGYGNPLIQSVMKSLNDNYTYDTPIATTKIDRPAMAASIDTKLGDFGREFTEDNGGIMDPMNYLAALIVIDNWDNNLGGIEITEVDKYFGAVKSRILNEGNNASKKDVVKALDDIEEGFKAYEKTPTKKKDTDNVYSKAELIDIQRALDRIEFLKSSLSTHLPNTRLNIGDSPTRWFHSPGQKGVNYVEGGSDFNVDARAGAQGSKEGFIYKWKGKYGNNSAMVLSFSGIYNNRITDAGFTLSSNQEIGGLRDIFMAAGEKALKKHRVFTDMKHKSYEIGVPLFDLKKLDQNADAIEASFREFFQQGIKEAIAKEENIIKEIKKTKTPSKADTKKKAASAQTSKQDRNKAQDSTAKDKAPKTTTDTTAKSKLEEKGFLFEGTEGNITVVDPSGEILGENIKTMKEALELADRMDPDGGKIDIASLLGAPPKKKAPSAVEARKTVMEDKGYSFSEQNGTWDVLAPEDGVIGEYLQTLEEAIKTAEDDFNNPIVPDNTITPEDAGKEEDTTSREDFLAGLADDLEDGDGDDVFKVVNIEYDNIPAATPGLKQEIADMLELLPKEISGKLIPGYVKLLSQGRVAVGSFREGMITVSAKAPMGTAFHEGFHAVFRTLLDQEQQVALIEEARKYYPIPKKGDIEAIMEDINVSRETAENIYYEELLADDFALYKTSPWQVNEAARYPKGIKGLFQQLLDWIKYVFTNKYTTARLFDNISRGKFKSKTPKFDRTVAYSTVQELGLSDIEAREVTRQLAGLAFQNVTTLEDLNTAHDNRLIILGIAKQYKKVQAALAKNPENARALEVKKRLALLLDENNQLKEVWQNAIDKYLAEEIGLVRKKNKAGKTLDNTDGMESDVNEDGENAWSISSYEISGKENATAAIKFIIAMTPEVKSYNPDTKEVKYNHDTYLGMPRLADMAVTYNKIESSLAGVVTTIQKNEPTDNFATMLDKLKAEGQFKPEYYVIAEKLQHLDESIQTQFHYAFSRSKNQYVLHLLSGKDKSIKSKITSSDINSPKNFVFDSFSKPFKEAMTKEVNGKVIYNKEAIEDFREFMTKTIVPQIVALSPEDGITPALLDNYAIALRKLGIELPAQALPKAIFNMPGDNILTKIKGFHKSFNTSTLPILKRLQGTEYKHRTNLINDQKGFFKEILAASAGEFVPIAGEHSFTGPEGNSIWEFQDNNSTSKAIARIKAGDMQHIDNVLNNPGSMNSRWAKMLKENPSFRNAFTLEQYGNTLKEGEGDRGDKAANLKPTDMFLDQIIKTLQGHYIGLAEADKGQQNYITGPSVESSNIGLVNGEGLALIGDNPKPVVVLKKYLADELNRMRHAHIQVFGDGKDVQPMKEEDMVENYHYYLVKPGTPGAFGKNKDKIKGGAFYSFLFPSLHSEVTDETGTRTNLERFGLSDSEGNIVPQGINQIEDNPDLSEFIAQAFVSLVRKDIQKALETDIISRDGDKLSNRLLPLKMVIEKDATRGTNQTEAILNIIGDYTFNSLIANVEMTYLFTGSPALYKVKGTDKLGEEILTPVKPEAINEFLGQPVYTEDGTLYSMDTVLTKKSRGEKLPPLFTKSKKSWADLDIFGDFRKRIPAAFASGKDFRIFKEANGEYAVRPHYMSAVVDNIDGVASGFFGTYEDGKPIFNEDSISKIVKSTGLTTEQVKKLFKPYLEVNRTDAQAWITLDAYRERMRGLGKWTMKGDNSHEAAYKAMQAGKPTPEQTMLLAQPLKTVHAELKPMMGGVLSMQYNKQSEAVLLPNMTKGTALDKLRLAMEKGKVDHVIVRDGKKAGASGVTSIEGRPGELADNIQLNPIKLSYLNLFLQQDLSSKGTKDTLVGSQAVKNVMSLINPEAMYGDLTGQQLLDEYHEVISRLSDIGLKELKTELKYDEVSGLLKDKDGVPFINKMLVREFSDVLSDQHLDALANGLPLDALPISQKAQSKLHAIITKKAVKLKQLGGALVQLSDFGWVGTQVQVTDTIKKGIIWFKSPEEQLQPMRIEEDGVKPAQVLIPFKQLRELFKKAGKDITGMSHAEVQALIPKSFLQGLSYRIPNQGPSSNDAFEIVGVLPEEAGDTMISYSAITTKTGSDFDIDKAFVILPNFGYNDKTGEFYYNTRGKEGDQNRRLEIMREALLHPLAYAKVMAPLDNPALENLAKELYPDNTSKADLAFYSGANQMETKATFDNAKTLVGIIANHMGHHALISNENITFKDYWAGIGQSNETIEAPKEVTVKERVDTGFVPANEGQANAVKAVEDYIARWEEAREEGKKLEPFVLIGKAGTGKTTVMADIIANLDVSKYSTVLISAISHKATNNLADKTMHIQGVHKATVAGALNMTMDESTGKFRVNKRDQYKTPPVGLVDIVFVDEASMLNEEAYSLLKTKAKGPIIFLGDSGQLPPIREGKDISVKDKDSIVFDSPNQSSLVERVRQSEESPLLPYADNFWNNSKAKSPVLNPGEERVSKMTPKGGLVFGGEDILTQVLPMYKKAVEDGEPNLIKTVVYRNKARHSINKQIREAILKDPSKQFQENELVIFNDSYSPSLYEEGYTNSDEHQIEYSTSEMVDGLMIYTLKFKGESLKVPTVGYESRAEYQKRLDDLKALKDKYGYESKEGKEAWKKWRELKDKYADIDYGYAITSHKSQGSTYNTVIVHEQDILGVSMTSNKSKSQSIYTALTRASQNAFVIDGSVTNKEMVQQGVEIGLATGIKQAGVNKDRIRRTAESVSVIEGPKKESTLSNSVDTNGVPIEEALGMYMNAIVDAAKDPYISRANINTFTSNTAFMLIRLGVPMEFVVSFIGQPIIMDLVKESAKQESRFAKYSPTKPTTTIMDKYLRETMLTPRDADKLRNETLRGKEGNIDITAQELQEQLKNPNPMVQVKVLNQFLEWQRKAKQLSELINLSKVDVNGATKNQAGAKLQENLLVKVVNSEAFSGLEDLLGEDLMEYALASYSERDRYALTRGNSSLSKVDSSYTWKKLKTKAVFSAAGVNTTRKDGFEHFGNPFTASENIAKKNGLILAPSEEAAVDAYEGWLLGNDYAPFADSNGEAIDVTGFNDQRDWIHGQLTEGDSEFNQALKEGKPLLMITGEPGSRTHAHVLLDMPMALKEAVEEGESPLELDVTNVTIRNKPRFIGTMFKNTVLASREIFKGQFLTATPAVEKLVERIAAFAGKTELLPGKATEALVDKITNEAYAAVIADAPAFNLTEAEFKELFFGSEEKGDIGTRILEAKEDPKYAGNLLIQSLQVRNKDLHPVASIFLPKNETVRSSKNDLTIAWDQLRSMDAALAEDLIRYSFYSTGFSTSIGAFHDHIPMSFLHETYFADRIKYKMGEFQNENALLAQVDNIFKHLADVNELVPNAVSEAKKPITTKEGTRFSTAVAFYIDPTEHPDYVAGTASDMSVTMKRFVKHIPKFTNNKTGEVTYGVTQLFQLAGMTAEGLGVYVRVNTLGYNEGPVHIKEYRSDLSKSAFPKNNVPDPKQRQELREVYKYTNNVKSNKVPLLPEQLRDPKKIEINEEELNAHISFCTNIN